MYKTAVVQAMRVYFSRPSSFHDEGDLVRWRLDGKPTVLKSKAQEVVGDDDRLVEIYHQIVRHEKDADLEILAS